MQHAPRTVSTNLSNIIKAFLSMWTLWRTQAVPTKKNLLRGNIYKRNEVLISARNTSTHHPDLHPNHIWSKNLKGNRCYEAHKNVSMNGHTDRWMETRLIAISPKTSLYQTSEKYQRIPLKVFNTIQTWGHEFNRQAVLVFLYSKIKA